MVVIIVTWVIVAWGAVSCIYMLRCAWSRFPKRDVDVDDVIPFLYPVDLSLAESLLDPAAEFEFRWKLSPRQFREAQRKRMRLYLELTRRMAHNSRVLVEYADAEKQSADLRRANLASALQDKAIEVRLYALLAGIKLRIWLLLRSDILKPVLAQLRTAGDIDGLETYHALKTAATAAFVQLPPDEFDSLSRNL
jgi:hypothetical protein